MPGKVRTRGSDIGADGVHAVDPKMLRELDDEISRRLGRHQVERPCRKGSFRKACRAFHIGPERERNLAPLFSSLEAWPFLVARPCRLQ